MIREKYILFSMDGSSSSVSISSFVMLVTQDLKHIKVHLRILQWIKVRSPFVQTLCIEKDSYMDAI